MVFDMAAAGAYTVILGSGPPLWMGATMHLRVQPSNILGFCCIEGSTMGLANTFLICDIDPDYDRLLGLRMGKKTQVNTG